MPRRRNEKVSIIYAVILLSVVVTLNIILILRLSHCPICQTRLLPRHIGPVHLYDDDIPLSFNANDRENQPNNMQTVHETNDAKTICTDNENNQIAETASNSLLISKNADANKTNESLTNNSLIAEHVSVNVSNDEFMDALDVTEHLNFDLETEAIESSSNQQVNQH